MNRAKKRKLILLFGKAGTGKTRTLKFLRPYFRRLVTIDPLEQYDGTVFYTFDELIEHVLEFNLVYAENFSLVCRFTEDSDIERLAKMCWIFENLCLAVEEFNIYFDARGAYPEFRKLTSQGRNKEISLILTSQRVPEIPPLIRAQKTSLITFQQDEPDDLKRLEDYGFSSESVSALVPFDSQEETEPTENYHYVSIGENLAKIKADLLE